MSKDFVESLYNIQYAVQYSLLHYAVLLLVYSIELSNHVSYNHQHIIITHYYTHTTVAVANLNLLPQTNKHTHSTNHKSQMKLIKKKVVKFKAICINIVFFTLLFCVVGYIINNTSFKIHYIKNVFRIYLLLLCIDEIQTIRCW